MTEKPMPAASLIAHKSVRCLLTALLAAAFSVVCAHLLALVHPDQQAYLFIVVTMTTFIAGLLHERMCQLAEH